MVNFEIVNLPFLFKKKIFKNFWKPVPRNKSLDTRISQHFKNPVIIMQLKISKLNQHTGLKQQGLFNDCKIIKIMSVWNILLKIF